MVQLILILFLPQKMLLSQRLDERYSLVPKCAEEKGLLSQCSFSIFLSPICFQFPFSKSKRCLKKKTPNPP